MTPHETTTYLARGLRLQLLVRVTLLVLLLGQLLGGRVCGAENGSDPYDTLYDVLMTRYAKDGKSYAENETSPVILPYSGFPFGDETYENFVAAVDAFGALPQETIDAYSDVKRALLQRHLWKVLDATHPYSWRILHNDRRAAVQPKIATLIRRLALTREQIQALPNTMARTVESGGFARRHDPEDQFKPFLPADIYSDDSSWICLGDPNHPISAFAHTRKLTSRSVFLQFMSLPGDRNQTLNYLENMHRRGVFPVGTQFALIQQAFLISDQGDLVLSPLIVSVQIRAFLDVDREVRVRGNANPNPTQCVSEFVMQPRQMMKGDAVMKAIAPSEFRFDAGQVDCGCFSPDDPFETGQLPTITRLNLCMRCHGGEGIESIETSGFYTRNGAFEEGSPELISEATSAQKRDDSTWKTLQALWLAEPKSEDRHFSAQADQPPLRDNHRKPDDRQPPTTAVLRSTLDPNDVLMVQHALARGGKRSSSSPSRQRNVQPVSTFQGAEPRKVYLRRRETPTRFGEIPSPRGAIDSFVGRLEKRC